MAIASSWSTRPFSRLAEVLAQAGTLPLDGCLVDLGVSSPQLDRGERGFSFRRAGPLDMRMDQSGGETATEYLGRVSEEELAAVLRDFGEERFARRIAREIVAARDAGPITTTDALAAIVSRAIPRREHHKDPATRTFQALRIAVNRELEELERFLAEVPGCLRPGGRLVVIAFHSLEDRMVKRRLRQLSDYPGGRGAGDEVLARAAGEPRFEILTKKPVTAGDGRAGGQPPGALGEVAGGGAGRGIATGQTGGDERRRAGRRRTTAAWEQGHDGGRATPCSAWCCWG